MNRKIMNCEAPENQQCLIWIIYVISSSQKLKMYEQFQRKSKNYFGTYKGFKKTVLSGVCEVQSKI